MKTLYVIDPTARQYGFQINDGLRIKIGHSTHTITGVEADIELFHNAIMSGESFVIYGKESFITFSADKIIGVKITEE
jgi:hypothetical protein